MTNGYYTSPSDVAAATKVRSIDLNTVDSSVDAAFDKLPTETNIKQGKVNYAVTGGSANAYTISLPHAPASYTDGLLVEAYIHSTNTGASTINVNSLGVKSIKLQNGDNPAASDLQKFVTMRYSTTTGFFHIQANSSVSAAAAAASATSAATSATNAATSATAAASSATSAATSATAAAASAASAATAYAAFDAVKFDKAGGTITGGVVIGDATANLTGYTPATTPLLWVQGNIQQEIRVNSYHSSAANATNIVLMKGRGTAASPADVQNGDQIAGFIPYAVSGSQGWHAGQILAVIDGTFTSGQQPPARLDLYAAAANTTPNLVLSVKTAGTQTTGNATATGSIGAGTTSPNPLGYDSAITASATGLAALGVQTTAADADNNVAGDYTFSATNNSGAPDIRVAYIRGKTSGATANWRGGQLDFITRTNGSTLGTALTLTNTQAVQFPNIGTTASAANAFIDNGANNNLLRSTSRAEFKTDVENIDPAIVKKVVDTFRPVWFRSLCDADRKDWSFYGGISDEVAKIDPRLVFWTRKIVGYEDEEYEEVVPDMRETDTEDVVIKNGKAVITPVKKTVQMYDEYPMFDRSGNPVTYEVRPAVYDPVLNDGKVIGHKKVKDAEIGVRTHRVPRTKKVKRIRQKPIYGEPIPDGIQYDRLGLFALAAVKLAQTPQTPPTPPRVPVSISRRQLVTWLYSAGKLDLAITGINAISNAVERKFMQIDWDCSHQIDRTSKLITKLSAILEMNPTALDDMFIAAAKL